MSGGVVSSTVTLAVHWLELLSSSVAVNVTVVSPSGKQFGALLPIVTEGSQISLAETPPKNAASWGSSAGVPHGSAHSTTMSVGHVISGSVVSSTVTSAVHVTVLMAPSLAVKVTVVTPSGK